MAYALATLIGIVSVTPAAAQDTETFFKNNCAACHTIGGGRLTGPDLKGASTRRDRAWLAEFIAAPIKKIERGDPYALALQKESYGMVMPTLPTLTPELVDALIAYNDTQSGDATAAPATAEPPAIVFTASDVDAGRAIFTGRQRLSGGGPACISCHTVKGVGALGGGQLAPDLTLVSQRLGGARGLTAWLGAPATPTMQSLFAKRALSANEITPLAAYFESSAAAGSPDGRRGLAGFAALGLSLAIVGLVVMDTAWKDRLRSVRRALVEQSKRS
jgi:mono/diheme cytochrome c family protein